MVSEAVDHPVDNFWYHSKIQALIKNEESILLLFIRGEPFLTINQTTQNTL